jgi:uncharacterized protein YtpQ (UPF0354 family)
MRGLIWATFLSLACAATAWGQTPRPQTIDDTLMLMHDEFVADPRVSSTNIDLEQRYISFTLGNGPLQISLPDTIHETLQKAADDAAREKALVQFIDFTISASQSAAPEAPLDLARIYPVIRPIGFGRDPVSFDFSRRVLPELDDEEKFSAPISLPFAADMEVFFVQDNDQVIEFVTADQLAQLELSASAVLDIAKQNLSQRDWDLEVAGGDGLHIIALNGDFETSFMLNHSFWQGVDVGLGSIVAVVAARDLVLFVDGNVEGAVDNLRTLVDPAVNEFPEAISTIPLKWEDGTWVPLN